MGCVSTSIPNVFASPSTVSLFEQFCSCPAAKKRLSSAQVIKPLFIQSTPLSGAHMNLEYDCNWNPIKQATIFIPESHLQTKEALADLAYEVFNAQTFSSDLLKQASQGNQGMDPFARKFEELELLETQGHFKLRKQCAKSWRLPPESDIHKDLDMETELFAQETQCHTDAIRQRWIDNFQENYCAKNPEDARSCKIRKNDLCDFQKLLAMPESERLSALRERVCKMFPNAHENVKSNPLYRMVIEENCPEVLRERSLAFLGKSIAIGLAAGVILGLYMRR